MALRRRNDSDTVMLSGDSLDRAQQALDIARQQVRRGHFIALPESTRDMRRESQAD